ncbi:RNase H domain-containing protein [Trichonephila inaurata madagascariensis]|uniref:RNase H domain-containing protein n=1 Tax=Trichonephila inaurata madagascariensis TaxID=2747483 RepID=A0A8X6X8C3_9ARAC|nr:RNase H domain-containing protein [Trichonephila inaurata madagascariensis]
MFLIRDVHFQKLPKIGNDTSDLEYLGITVLSKDRIITIKNLYHPPNSQHLVTNMMEVINPDLFPYGFWRVLDNIGSDHLPILVEIDLKVNYTGVKNLHTGILRKPTGVCLKISLTIFCRKDLFRTTWKRNGPISSTSFLQLLSLQSLGGKQIDNLNPSNEETNAIISDNGHVSVDAREAAETLVQHSANESRLAFSSSDKRLARITRNQIKSCTDRPTDDPLFNVDFTLGELSYALQNLGTNKSPGPDSIPGHFLSHLGILVGKDCYTYVTCHGKLANYQDSGNRPSLFPFINQTRMPVLRQAIVLFLLPASLEN